MKIFGKATLAALGSLLLTGMAGAQSPDPIVAYCQQDQMAHKLYDCSCLGDEAAAARADWASRQADPNGANASMIKYRKNQISLLEQQLAKTTDVAQRASLERTIDKRKQEIAGMGAPDPMSMGDAQLMMAMAPGTACRVREFVETDQHDACLRSGSSEALCKCVGFRVANGWMNGDIRTYNSKSIVGAATSARGVCNR